MSFSSTDMSGGGGSGLIDGGDSGPAKADVAACREQLRTGSRSFFAASFFLPRGIRTAASVLYAFCRQADDAVDIDGNAEALTRLQEQVDRIYSDAPADDPMERAFAHVAHQYALPRALPESLLEGLAWDTEGRRYETISDVRAYGARVAGTVGSMMTVLMGVRDSQTQARACDLGVAMQLTNIARDVGEDARNGRIYLPLDWMHEAGIEPDAFLSKPVFTPALGQVVERLLTEAEVLYDRASSGIPQLPPAARPGIEAARVLYREIGEEVARNGYDSISQRAVVSPARKAAVLASAMIAGPSDGRDLTHEALPETVYLIDAIAAAGPGPAKSLATFGDRLEWTLELFERMDRRGRSEPARSPAE